MGGVHLHVRTPFPSMVRLLLLGKDWADCAEIWYAIGVPLVVVHAIVTGGVSLHVRTALLLGRLCSKLVCGLGVINYVLSTSHG